MDYCIDHLTDSQAQMHSFWDLIRVEIDSIKADHTAFKTQDLPLARIKKIMKLDDDIKCMVCFHCILCNIFNIVVLCIDVDDYKLFY